MTNHFDTAPASRPPTRSTAEPATEPAAELAKEPAAEPAAELAKEPAAEPGTRSGPAPDRRATGPGLPPPGVVVLAALSLAWLALMLRSTHVGIEAAHGVFAIAIASAASALPPAVSASLIAGIAVGLVAVRVLVGRRPTAAAGARFAVAVAAGVATGATGMAGVVSAGAGPATAILAGTIAAAAVLGGALAGARASSVIAAAVAGTLAVFTIGLVCALFLEEPLLTLYGYGETDGSKASAYLWFAVTTSLAGGLAAGVLAFQCLRRTWRPGPDATPLRHGLRYLAAGAGAGLLLLAAEAVTQVGGAQILSLTSALSADDRIAQDAQEAFRLKYALALLFIGGITAMIAFGRTVPGAGDGRSEAGGEHDPAG